MLIILLLSVDERVDCWWPLCVPLIMQERTSRFDPQARTVIAGLIYVAARTGVYASTHFSRINLWAEATSRLVPIPKGVLA